MITYESEGERLADTTACAGVRADLKLCLLESDCCRMVGPLQICPHYYRHRFQLYLG